MRFYWAVKRMLRDKADFGVLEGFSAFLTEEILHELAALVFEDAAFYLCLGMQGMRGKGEETTLLVTTAIDHMGHLRPA